VIAYNFQIKEKEDSVFKAIELDSVLVKSQYKYARRQGNKFVVSFRGSPFYKDKSIAEALSICPLIVRINESFNILGKSSTVIYIDGRPSTLDGEHLYALLNSEMAKEIDHVEIIASPTAQYDASMKSGIINIITSRKSEIGFMSMLQGGVTRGKKWGGNGSSLFALKNKNLNINLFLNGIHSLKSRISSNHYFFSDENNKDEKSLLNQKGTPFALSYSTDWTLKNNNLGLEYSFSNLKVDNRANQIVNGIHLGDKNSNIRNVNHTLQLYDTYHLKFIDMSLLYNMYFRRNNIILPNFSTGAKVKEYCLSLH
jgi:hypothetical protein